MKGLGHEGTTVGLELHPAIRGKQCGVFRGSCQWHLGGWDRQGAGGEAAWTAIR